MLKLKSLLKESKEKENCIQEDGLVELSEDEVDSAMAVGNSIQTSKWFLKNDLSYLLNKKIF